MGADSATLDFRVRVLQEPDGTYVVCDDRGERAPFGARLSDESLYRLSYKMAGNRRLTRARYYTLEDRKLARTVGEALFSSLVNGAVAESFRTLTDRSDTEGSCVRIILDLTGAPALLNYPWEFLYDSVEGSYVATAPDRSLVRLFDLARRIPSKLVTPPLRVLVVSASPPGLPKLNVDAEVTGLNNAASAQLGGIIAIEHLADPTLGELKRFLDAAPPGRFDILHFIGHGGFSGESKTTTLSFPDGRGQIDDVSPDRFAAVVRNRGMPLAILNACEGGRTDAGDPFAGVAIDLLRARFAAVVAMQFEITDSAAADFSRNVYAQLARGAPIDRAVAQARSQVFAEQETLEWATPVLYAGSAEMTPVFGFSEAQPAPAEKPPVAVPPRMPDVARSNSGLKASPLPSLDEQAKSGAGVRRAWPNVRFKLSVLVQVSIACAFALAFYTYGPDFTRGRVTARPAATASQLGVVSPPVSARSPVAHPPVARATGVQPNPSAARPTLAPTAPPTAPPTPLRTATPTPTSRPTPEITPATPVQVPVHIFTGRVSDAGTHALRVDDKLFVLSDSAKVHASDSSGNDRPIDLGDVPTGSIAWVTYTQSALGRRTASEVLVRLSAAVPSSVPTVVESANGPNGLYVGAAPEADMHLQMRPSGDAGAYLVTVDATCCAWGSAVVTPSLEGDGSFSADFLLTSPKYTNNWYQRAQTHLEGNAVAITATFHRVWFFANGTSRDAGTKTVHFARP